MKKTMLLVCLIALSCCKASAVIVTMPNAQVLATQLERNGFGYIDKVVKLSQKMAEKELTSFDARRIIEVGFFELREHYLSQKWDEEWRGLVFIHELWAKHRVYKTLLPYEVRTELWWHQLLPFDVLTDLSIDIPEDFLEQFQK